MKKVIVIGCPGSGKTTFAEKLNKYTYDLKKMLVMFKKYGINVSNVYNFIWMQRCECR